MKNIYHFFAGTMSGTGFINNFDKINNKQIDSLTYIIKGTSGSGKSTLIKKIGKYFEEQGKHVEYFYCSADPNSLDGVRLADENISVVDGTSPHNLDISNCNIDTKIINLTEFIDDEIIFQDDNILSLSEKKKVCYKSMQNYLSCAKILFDENYNLMQKNIKFIEEKSQKLIKKLNLKKINNKKFDRQLFLDYISTDGVQSLMDKNIFDNKITLFNNIYVNDKILHNIYDYSSDLGYSTIAFLNIFNPNCFDCVYIREIDLFIQGISEICDDEKVKENNRLINLLTQKASRELDNAKSFHKEIENLHKPYINFKMLDDLTAKTIKSIEQRIFVQLKKYQV